MSLFPLKRLRYGLLPCLAMVPSDVMLCYAMLALEFAFALLYMNRRAMKIDGYTVTSESSQAK